jgi:starch phosphorylase
MVNNDPDVADKLRVVFVQNYNVSYAEKLVAAADVSEQISLAGMEASGTGNMKFMLNGTVTLGTMDGANIEICEEAGRENNYIFGLSVDEVRQVKSWYNPRRYAEEHWEILRLVDTMVNGTFSDGGKGVLQNLYNSLFYNWEPDNYLVLYDLADYIRVKLIANSEYGTEEFITKSLMNMVNAGKFSSDRSVKDYRDNIWHI